MAAPDAELTALLDKFVRVRLVQMGGVDLELYQFDPLLSWSLFFMNGNKTIYGRFGTASPQANRNKRDSNNNHTMAGLKAALKGALRIHDQYMADRGELSKRLAQKTGPKPLWRYAEKTPAARKYRRIEILICLGQIVCANQGGRVDAAQHAEFRGAPGILGPAEPGLLSLCGPFIRFAQECAAAVCAHRRAGASGGCANINPGSVPLLMALPLEQRRFRIREGGGFQK